MSNLTSNQYYRGLNRRFERRASLLRRRGSRYQIVQIGADKRSTTGIMARGARVVSASAIMHADRRAWLELLPSLLLRPGHYAI
jgi:hypothetical protein